MSKLPTKNPLTTEPLSTDLVEITRDGVETFKCEWSVFKTFLDNLETADMTIPSGVTRVINGKLEIDGNSVGFSSGITLKTNGVTVLSLDQFGSRLFGAWYTNVLNASGNSAINIGSQSGGGNGTISIHPFNGYITIPGSNPTEPLQSLGTSWFPRNTAGITHSCFKNSNNDVIELRKQDLPANPTNAELATFLSNIGLANLI